VKFHVSFSLVFQHTEILIIVVERNSGYLHSSLEKLKLLVMILFFIYFFINHELFH